ncbi:MAG: VCBS repeat-containing protein [Bacteroidales bacterium]
MTCRKMTGKTSNITFKKHRFILSLSIIVLLLPSCEKQNPSKLFTLLPSSKTGITFVNNLTSTEELNTYTYRNFYNGAGVGIGDFNNDGLMDIYFCGNQAGNKLYINKGNFSFEDVTVKAGVECKGSWSTGVTIADVNGDGWSDIYVSKSGAPDTPHRSNELFINNGDLTFTEKAAEYGLDVKGLSNHAAFFDYDRDGDLDCYILSNSYQSVTEFNMKPGERSVRDSLGGNRLMRNDNGHFTDVSASAGIYGSKIGFGLGVSIGDLNRDGWPDIYISNDFFERDYLYINNKNGTFTECLEDELGETSQGAMGADIADINNDSWPEIFVTEMTPEDNSRRKTKALFDTWETYNKKISTGYHHQFERNVLQLNNHNGTFSEIGRFSGVSTTDWSWGALIMDLDNDGWKDIFVANGIYKDLLDRDYLDIYSDPTVMRSMIRTEDKAILKIIDKIPSVSIPNYAFHNNGDLTFTNMSAGWGLGTPSFSNGAVYTDLDNDGDLDLVVNNVNMAPFIYRNETAKLNTNSYLELILKGAGTNTGAIGAEVEVFNNGSSKYAELVPSRGFMSSTDPRIHLGLGEWTKTDSVNIFWPDGRFTSITSPGINKIITIEEKLSEKIAREPQFTGEQTIFNNEPEPVGLDFMHSENDFNDFSRDKLLIRMLSNEGPHMAVADVNGDKLEDIYICGAKGSPGCLYIQDIQGHFRKSNTELFEKDRISEETDCAFFDANGDGFQDLYVACGGNEFSSSSSALADRLYLNNGKGVFTKSEQILPAGKYESSSCVRPCDYDNDGVTELFVGIRLKPFAYGIPVNGYLLENDGKGNFTNVSAKLAPELKNIGMITGMTWADIDGDKDMDMIIVGDWMPVKILVNNNGKFTDESAKRGLSGTEGWWNTVEAVDINGDGFIDFVAGNHGLNTYFKASDTKPVTMYVNDFDLNGSVEQVICAWFGDRAYPVVMKDELVSQIPSLASRYSRFADYADKGISDIFTPEILKRSLVLKAAQMKSCAFINDGKGSFTVLPLPDPAQFTPIYSILAGDFNQDGITDIITGGNQYRAKPQWGIYDAGYGLLLQGRKDSGFKTIPSVLSGITVKGEIRDMKILNIKGKSVLTIARNNNNLQFYSSKNLK